MSQRDSSNDYVVIDEQMYQVEEVKGKRTVGGVVQYLVKWKHWDRPEDMTWEPLGNLSTVPDLIQKYEKSISYSGTNKGNKAIIDVGSIKREAIIDKKQTKQRQKINQKIKREPRQTRSKEHKQKKLKKVRPEIHRKPATKQIQISGSQSQQINMSSEHESSDIRNSNSSVQVVSRIQIGQINSILVRENGQVFYQVDLINKNGDCIGVKLIHNNQLKMGYSKQLMRFLQDYLIDQQRYSNMLV